LYYKSARLEARVTTPASFRLEDGLLARLSARAEAEKVSRNELIVRLLEHGLKTEGLETVLLSTSEIECLDLLAERQGKTRAQLSSRFLRERLRREFVDDRNSLMHKLKKAG
jgi:predicted DNA-binding ribbon-helix-helix protein